MRERHKVNGLRFKIESISNGSFLATFLGRSPHADNGNFSSGDLQELINPEKPYDDTGALYYVIIVVFIYGFSIILMIGSLIKRSETDSGVVYMKEMEKLRRVERRREKFKTRLVMSQRRVQRAMKMLRPNPDSASTTSTTCTEKWDSASLGPDWAHPGTARRQLQGSSWSLISGRGTPDTEDTSLQGTPCHVHPLVVPPSPGPAEQPRKPEVKIEVPDDCDPGNALLNAAFAIPFLTEVPKFDKLDKAAGALSVEDKKPSVSSLVSALDPVKEVEEEKFSV